MALACRDLLADYYLDAKLPGEALRLPRAGDGVVVGDGDDSQVGASDVGKQLGDARGAVAGRGVEVEVRLAVRVLHVVVLLLNWPRP